MNGKESNEPVINPEESLYEWARKEFTDEEIATARNESGGYRLDEILAELRIMR